MTRAHISKFLKRGYLYAKFHCDTTYGLEKIVGDAEGNKGLKTPWSICMVPVSMKIPVNRRRLCIMFQQVLNNGMIAAL